MTPPVFDSIMAGALLAGSGLWSCALLGIAPVGFDLYSGGHLAVCFSKSEPIHRK